MAAPFDRATRRSRVGTGRKFRAWPQSAIRAWPLFPHALSAIDVVMRSDIQQHDLGSREAENQDDAVGIGQADRMFVGVSSLEPVQSQTGRLRISLQLLDDVLEQTDS